MRDLDVRRLLTRQLREVHAAERNTLLLEEMDLGKARIDVAVLNGELTGFEIKSDRDTLSRLPHQCEVYGRVFNRLTLVVGETHAEAAENLVPKWWGVVVATIEGLVSIRAAGPNPSLCSVSLAKLLWRDELLAILISRSLHRGVISKPRRTLIERFVDSTTPNEVSEIVRETIKSRVDWRGDLL